MINEKQKSTKWKREIQKVFFTWKVKKYYRPLRQTEFLRSREDTVANNRSERQFISIDNSHMVRIIRNFVNKIIYWTI
jgi:hypothetical protein